MAKQTKKEITPLTETELTEQLNAHLLEDIRLVADLEERKQATYESVNYHLNLAQEADKEYNLIDKVIAAIDLKATEKYRKNSKSFKQQANEG